MTWPDSDTLWILVPCGLLVVAQVLDWCGVEWWAEPKEPRGFEVEPKRKG